MKVRDMRQPGWAWCKNELIREHGSELGPYGIATYMALASFSGKDESARPSIRTIAETIGASKSSVKRSIDDLVSLGWIKVQHRKDGKKNKSNIYFLLPSPVNGSSQNGGGVSENPGVGSERTEGGSSQNCKEEPTEEEPTEEADHAHTPASDGDRYDFSFLPQRDLDEHLDDILDTVNSLQVTGKLDLKDLKRATVGGLSMNRSERRALSRFAKDHTDAEIIAAATMVAKKGLSLSTMPKFAEQWAKEEQKTSRLDRFETWGAGT